MKKMSFEQRANIKFCFKLGKTFTETFNMMKEVYGVDCLSRARVHKWFKRFQEGREDIKDDDHPGPANTVVTETNIERVREFIKNEPDASLRHMEVELNMSKNSIQRILTDHLHMRTKRSLKRPNGESVQICQVKAEKMSNTIRETNTEMEQTKPAVNH
uniref:Mos1 transposase HTH domain-containing protein n=1 Tax=Ceratitis capitata TaxID=7213 RepID=W8CAR2_CERCA